MKTILRSTGFYLLIFIPFLISQSCSKYQKVLNGDDVDKKLEYAEKYYQNKQYSRALALLDEVYRFYVGTEKGEKVTFYLAYSNYYLNNYLLASYYFKKLADTYPRGEHAEESMYMYAYTQYLNSPQSDLDQSNTRSGIEAFQYFINRFPKSDKVDEANRYMDILGDKLRDKTFNAAMTYYKIRDYKAAAWALKAALEEYPVVDNREEVEMKILDSYFQLAENSVDEKKEERYLDVVEFYQEFIGRYPNSKYQKEAQDMYEKAVQQLELLKEKAEFKNLESSYELAENSSRNEQERRFRELLTACQQFEKAYPNSPMQKQTRGLQEKTQQRLEAVVAEQELETLKSYFKLANASLEGKKEERYRDVLKFYHGFVERHPECKYRKDAKGIYKETQQQLDIIKLNEASNG